MSPNTVLLVTCKELSSINRFRSFLCKSFAGKQWNCFIYECENFIGTDEQQHPTNSQSVNTKPKL